MIITEPTTMLTDYILSVSSFWWAPQIHSIARSSAMKIWAAGFLVAGFAALAGGTFHGFTLYLSSLQAQLLWVFTVASIIGSGLLMIAGAALGPIGPGGPWLIRGLLFSALGGTVLLLRVSFHTHFNQNDLYHVIQWIGLYLFYRGVRIFPAREDRKESSPDL